MAAYFSGKTGRGKNCAPIVKPLDIHFSMILVAHVAQSNSYFEKPGPYAQTAEKSILPITLLLSLLSEHNSKWIDMCSSAIPNTHTKYAEFSKFLELHIDKNRHEAWIWNN